MVCHRQISRAVVITDQSILPSESDQQVLGLSWFMWLVCMFAVFPSFSLPPCPSNTPFFPCFITNQKKSFSFPYALLNSSAFNLAVLCVFCSSCAFAFQPEWYYMTVMSPVTFILCVYRGRWGATLVKLAREDCQSRLLL